ncbi:MAG: hypothetical protein HQL03_02800 [Nitrospirae bacterium]|nr:hypothetical protein [Nitrospirota bacterium]MBF0590883.1 hypothetical protein [Nitrospirota bacterium]
MRKVRVLCLLFSFIFTAGFLLVPRGVTANPLTAAAIITAARNLVQALNNIGPSLGTNGQVVVNDAVQQLNTLANKLEKIAGKNIKDPLENLGLDAQNIANTLMVTTSSINSMLTVQRNCLAKDSGIFLAGVQTTIANAKKGIPFVKSGTPFVSIFSFAGNPPHTPFIIPPDGGTMTISGYALREKLPTQVSIVDSESKKTVFTPIRGSSNDEVSLSVSKKFIQENTGKCLTLGVEPMEKQGFLFSHGKTTITQLNIPFCVPQDFAVQLRLTGTIAFSCTNVTTSPVPVTGYVTQINDDCDHTTTVGYTFAMSVPQGCRIIEATAMRGNNTRNEIGATHASFTDSNVTLTGQIGAANCAGIPFTGIKKENNHAVWQYAASAIKQCSEQIILTVKNPVMICLRIRH